MLAAVSPLSGPYRSTWNMPAESNNVAIHRGSRHPELPRSVSAPMTAHTMFHVEHFRYRPASATDRHRHTSTSPPIDDRQVTLPACVSGLETLTSADP